LGFDEKDAAPAGDVLVKREKSKVQACLLNRRVSDTSTFLFSLFSLTSCRQASSTDQLGSKTNICCFPFGFAVEVWFE
jgi:hypothetical protein